VTAVRVACVGDVMCGDQFTRIGWGAGSSIDTYGRGFVPDEITAVFHAHDVVLCNVECVLSDVGRKEYSLRSLQMRGRARTAKYLAEWGITAAHLANNHILEHGVEAARDTARNLAQAGIRVVGAGPDGSFDARVTATRMLVNEMPLSIVGACFHPGGYAFRPATFEQVLETVRTEVREGHIVIVSLHWGDELIDRPNLWQQRAARDLIHAGARLIAGHHAHVFQGVYRENGSLVAYSLGNFIFDYEFDPTKWTAILSVSIGADGVMDWKTIPIRTGPDYRPTLANGEDEAALQREIARRCDLVAEMPREPGLYEQAYRRELKSLEQAGRTLMWKIFLKDWRRHRPLFWPQALLRPIRRRLGLW
jgi:poly-gamma-glutamate synthesis protein (capsule biosynthesis protein)